jgi:hypothetical protein
LSVPPFFVLQRESKQKDKGKWQIYSWKNRKWGIIIYSRQFFFFFISVWGERWARFFCFCVKSSSKVPFFSFSVVVVVVVVTRLKSFNNNQAIPASQPL